MMTSPRVSIAIYATYMPTMSITQPPPSLHLHSYYIPFEYYKQLLDIFLSAFLFQLSVTHIETVSSKQRDEYTF